MRNTPQAPQQEARTIGLLRRLFLAAILLEVVVGAVLSQIIEVELEDNTRWLVLGVLSLVALSNTAITMGVVLPSNASAGAPAKSVAALGYVFADAVALQGMVASIVTGLVWVPCPFGVMALISWQFVNNFLSDRYRDTLSPGGEFS